MHGLLGIDRNVYQLLKEYVPNYKINLIEPRKLWDLSCFQTDLQIIFGMLKYKNSKEALREYVQSHKNYFSNIEEDSYNAVRVLLGSESSLKEVKQKKGEHVDMCKALDDLYQDGVKQGIEQGIRALILVLQKNGYDKAKVLNNLQEGFSLNSEEAEAYYEKFEIEQIQE